MLALHWEGVDHAVFVFWTGPERKRDCWYLVWRNGSPTWEWKDVDEFAATGELRYPGRMDEIQAEGDRVAKLLDSGERWWDESWEHWQPDPQWTVPTLPTAWTEVSFTTR